jgi:hypothetical protein
MRELLTLVATILVTGCVGTARLGEAEVYNFDCDVPAARFSEWSRTLRATPVTVSGTVQLIEPRQDVRWWPIASILLSGGDGVKKTGLRFMLARETPDQLEILLQGPDNNAQRVVLGYVSWRKGPVPFSVSIDAVGNLTVSAADSTRTARLANFELAKLKLSCSTAQFKFVDVSVAVN